MTLISKKDTLRLVKLSNLKLGEKEINSLARDLSEIVGYFKALTELDLRNIPETSQTTGLVDVLRADSVDNTRILSVEGALVGTDNIHNNLFVVPQTIDKNK